MQKTKDLEARVWEQWEVLVFSRKFKIHCELLLRSEMWCRGPLVCRLLFFFTDRYRDLPIKHHYTCDAKGLPNKMSEKNLYLSVR